MGLFINDTAETVRSSAIEFGVREKIYSAKNYKLEISGCPKVISKSFKVHTKNKCGWIVA